jgi:hypothetical protein
MPISGGRRPPLRLDLNNIIIAKLQACSLNQITVVEKNLLPG